MAPPEEVEVTADRTPNGVPHDQTFDELGVLGVDGSRMACGVYHPPPRGFEQPTETFVRKTGMRDKGPLGYEYNNTEYLSVSAAVKPCTPGPTRDDRLEDAGKAAQTRADEARKIAMKSRWDRHVLRANPAKTAKSRTSTNSPGSTNKPSALSWKQSTGSLTPIIRPPRSRSLEDQALREAIEAKAQAMAASPREGKPDPETQRRLRGGGNRRKLKRGPAASDKRDMYHGIAMPGNTFEKPFAGGNEVDALPGRLESLIFPQRYVDWPKEDASLPALALDVQRSPIRHAVAFRSKQPRIVCYDPQRETRGWDGPGAYEWDDRPDDNDTDTNATADIDMDGGGGGGKAPGDSGGDGGGGGRGRKSAEKGGARPRGIAVRDPGRPSPAFREGSSAFLSPTQTNVRGFALAPSSKRVDAAAAAAAEGRDVTATGAEASETGNRSGAGAGGSGASRSARSAAKKKAHGGHRRKPQTLWMFKPPGREPEPAVATLGWEGPGAYAIEIGTGVRVKEPGRKSPVFREGSGGKRGRDVDRREREKMVSPGGVSSSAGPMPEGFAVGPGENRMDSPGTPESLASWSSLYPEFSPPAPKMSNGGDMAGPVERYDLVSSRRQPPPATSIGGSNAADGDDGAGGRTRGGVASGSEGGALAPLSLAAVGTRLVSSQKRTLARRVLPAAAAAELAAAATAAAGLARNWAGRQADAHAARGGRGPGGAEADRQDGLRSDSTDVRANGMMTQGVDDMPEPSSTVAELFEALSTDAGPPTHGRRVAASSYRRQGWRHEEYQSKKKRSVSSVNEIGAGDVAQTAGGGLATRNTSAFGGGGPASHAPRQTADGVAMTEAGLAAAEMAAAEIEKAATAAAAEKSLIRTVGRAKRGPCMLTLTPSSSYEIGQQAARAGTTCRTGEVLQEQTLRGDSFGSCRGPLVFWEVEPAGGLLGSGETKVLRC
ncbi:hypothetical protein Esi_0072_0090 [Ectocarpus siliculosus]|uniref:Uncharacterized protein n=1 Tax=Ectocarpus siliculosus TaxID=2880 RepID=D8LSG5_ECTSI|nr:hypothetical protein Esi_0072_0090 [Ectocarpus siliculosus]|eukprot:CBN75222.1 hypothetical protein Esi_0072_0090 [Ectocarpus siliculosus]